MGEQQFSIDDDGPPRIAAVWMGAFKDVVVTLDGVELVRVAHLKQSGSINCVVDGQQLTLVRIKGTYGDHLDARIAGRRLLGSALHPVTHARRILRAAPFSMITTSVITFLGWIHTGSEHPAFPDDVETRLGALLLGIAVALTALAVLVVRRSTIAPLIALGLLAFHAIVVIAVFSRVNEPFAVWFVVGFDLLAFGNCIGARRAMRTLEAKVGAVGGSAAPVGASATVRSPRNDN